jgi:hypothetical protein
MYNSKYYFYLKYIKFKKNIQEKYTNIFHIEENMEKYNRTTDNLNKVGILYFHQGWTDIFNCLSLIDYYYQYDYDKIYLLIRNDAKAFIDYYIENKKDKIIPLYVDKYNLDNYNFGRDIDNIKSNKIILFHGGHDSIRTDKYKNNYVKIPYFFVESFYSCYDIEYMNRVKCFNVARDLELENITYNNFIQKYGDKYILHHEINDIEKKYDVEYVVEYVNLNGISDIFFDYIKVLENAIEIHLLDSVWGALVYLLDAKYKLFSNKKIYIYCRRNYIEMFIKPVKLENWIFV